eukprot:TRINITY_DN21409_c0_g1_i1.p1 TRINITY_DN21409_c0_g1~~TRINITY_DN21409_c0_g1_i1.p1  ORF type:complete len:431 (+),score=163.45 TRINITY_DN21409_c0_g1_i1:117-1295(+)
MEDEFFVKQAKLRVQIRIKEGRATPVDRLFSHLAGEEKWNGTTAFIESIAKLPPDQIQSVLQDITIFNEMDPSHSEFWAALRVVAQDSLAESNRDGVHKAISADVSNIFAGKNYDALIKLEEQITKKIENGGDPEYWEGLLKRLVFYKAKAKLHEINQRIESDYGKSGSKTKPAETKSESKPSPAISDESESKTPYIYKSSSEKPIEPIAKFVDPKRAKLEEEMKKIKKNLEADATGVQMNDDQMWKRELENGMAEGEEPFNTAQPLPDADPSLKAPRFFNRVIMGCEWNKYNQTHYDQDNPPPKTILGYRFNIFYPDLADLRKTPHYRVEKLPETPDFVILRFVASAPYSDVTFMIANREWEHSHKKGFRCAFERGIMHLHFSFKKYRYRR